MLYGNLSYGPYCDHSGYSFIRADGARRSAGHRQRFHACSAVDFELGQSDGFDQLERGGHRSFGSKPIVWIIDARFFPIDRSVCYRCGFWIDTARANHRDCAFAQPIAVGLHSAVGNERNNSEHDGLNNHIASSAAINSIPSHKF